MWNEQHRTSHGISHIITQDSDIENTQHCVDESRTMIMLRLATDCIVAVAPGQPVPPISQFDFFLDPVRAPKNPLDGAPSSGLHF